MISHEHRCIFVHVQRCAGSSVEKWITGSDWWLIEPSTKHILASQAKKLYAPYWKTYFKFSVVREPVSRMLSCLKYADHFGLSYDAEHGLSLTNYRRKFGRKIVIEYDHRYYRRRDLVRRKHRPGCVYGNILDEELDFIGHFETLHDDMNEVGKCIGMAEPFGQHLEKAKPGLAHLARLRDQEVAEIRAMFRLDMERFGYADEIESLVQA